MSALYNAEIINGKSEGIFAPNDFLTREEAATILFRVFMIYHPDTKLNKRPTVPEYADDDRISDWAMTGVYIISAAGIMQGVGDNYFAPQEKYTIEQAITTILRLYDYNKANISVLSARTLGILAAKGDKLTWSDFEIFQQTDLTPNGAQVRRYPLDIEGFYVILRGDSLDKLPEYIYLVHEKTNEKIDIRYDNDISKFMGRFIND